MKFERELLKGVAPLAVLHVLSRGAHYGYQLGTALEAQSGRILVLGKGTLYPLLYNLEAKGLIAGRWEESESGRRRRYYSITGKGERLLARQKQQWRKLQEAMVLLLGTDTDLDAAPAM